MVFDGIININKPPNMTSHDVVAVVRRTLGVKRVGHTGTLDPMATGVLPVCVGKATRIMEYLDTDLKSYRCTLILGMITDTQDIWGKTIEKKKMLCISAEKVEQGLEQFRGIIQQLPPMYSAIKVDGRRLYDYARNGEMPTKEIKKRKIYIKDIQLENVDFEEGEITFNVTCSKGTYIRTICQDLGEYLGCGATMKSLVRTGSGAFRLENAIDLEHFRTMTHEEISSILLPTDFPFKHMTKVIIPKESAIKFINGWHLEMEKSRFVEENCGVEPNIKEVLGDKFRELYTIYGEINDNCPPEFLGVAYFSTKYGKLVADKVFYRRYTDGDS